MRISTFLIFILYGVLLANTAQADVNNDAPQINSDLVGSIGPYVFGPDVAFNGNDARLRHQSGFNPEGTNVWQTDTSRPHDQSTYLTHGPSSNLLTNGAYIARFTLLVDNNTAADLVLATIDVNDIDHNKTIAQRDIKRRDFTAARKNQDFDLPFIAPGDGSHLDFRVYYHCCTLLQHARTLILPGERAKSWSIGVKDSFVLSSNVVDLPALPTNRVFHPLKQFADIISKLHQRHVGIYSDIIPIEMIAPSTTSKEGKPERASDYKRYWNDIRNILLMFKKDNVSLVLPFGMPLSQWMWPKPSRFDTHKYEWSGWCPMVEAPYRDEAWSDLENNLASTIGEFVGAMANDPELKGWFVSHVFIVPYDEFDSIGTAETIPAKEVCPEGGTTPCKLTPAHSECDHSKNPTGKMAADLSNKLVSVLNHYGATVQIHMPSSVKGGEKSISYLREYYASHGSGLPNVHMYFAPGSTPEQALNQFRTRMADYQAAVPKFYQSRFFIGEIGVARPRRDCNPLNIKYNFLFMDKTQLEEDVKDKSLPFEQTKSYRNYTKEQNILYENIITDPKIMASTEAIVFWRLLDLPAGTVPKSCINETFGLSDSSVVRFTPAATGFFNGIDKIAQKGF